MNISHSKRALACTLTALSLIASSAPGAIAEPDKNTVQGQQTLSPQLQPLDDADKAKETFNKLHAEGYTSQDFEQNGEGYTQFELEEGVFLTLPNFMSSTPGDKGAVEIVPSGSFTTYSNDPTTLPDIRLSPKVQRIILAAGVGAIGGAIGGALGGAIGAGVAAWLGDNGICPNQGVLVIHHEKAISWLPYDPAYNNKTTYRCE